MRPILIDTSVIIDFLRRTQKENFLFFRLIDTKSPLSISIITHSELYAGRSVWESKMAQRLLDEILSGLTIIPLSTTISIYAGKLRLTKPLSLPDALIAATAIEEKIPLATLNIKHFQKIKDLKLHLSFS